MIKRIKLLALLLIIAPPCLIGFSAGRAKENSNLISDERGTWSLLYLIQEKPAPQAKTVGQVYKNIQVLKEMPASQLDSVMAFFTGSLGVRCNYCHVNPFEKDDKPQKQTARKMIQMVFALNKENFSGQTAVSCNTCHRGQPQPVSVPALGQNLWQPSNQASKPVEAQLPTVEQILDRYVQAIGGREAIEKIKSRVIKGSRVGADGVLVPEEIYSKAPNKMLVVTSYPNLVFRTGFNGTQAWAKRNQDVRDVPEEALAEVRREAEFYKETKLREMYAKMTVVGTAAVGSHTAYVIEATPADSTEPDRFYFDTQTGLLLRKYSESRTVIGQFPSQIDYEDYREVDGVKIPFSIRWAIPGRVWGRKITEVKQNVPLDDAQFNLPAFVK